MQVTYSLSESITLFHRPCKNVPFLEFMAKPRSSLMRTVGLCVVVHKRNVMSYDIGQRNDLRVLLALASMSLLYHTLHHHRLKICECLTVDRCTECFYNLAQSILIADNL